MNTFKRKALTCAVLAGLGAVATTAEAVYKNPDNTGQVLIYPYYTVQAGFSTYVTIVNTTSAAKALKIRFREGKTSAEVEDHNIFLSPNDMYVAVITASGPNATDPARINAVGDTSCTLPNFGASGFFDFRNIIYSVSPDSLPQSDTSLDRTREGYIEVFDMVTLTGADATGVTHVGGAKPTGCPTAAFVPTAPTAPTGGLTGTVTLINTVTGADMGYTADALDAFTTLAVFNGTGNLGPALTDATPPVSLVLANGSAYQDTWGPGTAPVQAGSRAVAAVFMHSSVSNEYILDANTASNTDWVLTFPGKRDFFNGISSRNPFSNNITTAGACEPSLFSFWNRDENTGSTTSISPAGTPPNTPPLCFESTVVSIRNGGPTNATGSVSGVLGSINTVAVSLPSSSFSNGWARITFTGARSQSPAGGLNSVAGQRLPMVGAVVAGAHTFVGLPVTGFMARSFKNATLPCTTTAGGATTCSVLFESNYAHGYRTTILP